MSDQQQNKLSTSALAKSLEVPSQQLFGTLKDYGWINKLEDGWVLTTKGEFEGGEYVHSKKFGRYIVWPDTLAEHPLLQALEDNRHTTATSLGKTFSLNAREVNRIFAELAWIKHGLQGWEVTPLGKEHGGIQLENESSGTFYVVWPQTIQSHPALQNLLHFSASLIEPQAQKTDLFQPVEHFTGLDGHKHSHLGEQRVCHWLYMAGFAHACQRQLPVAEPLFADFYLPAHQLYIECWHVSEGPSLSERLARKAVYEKFNMAFIEVQQQDYTQLDDFLTRQFRRLGIRVY